MERSIKYILFAVLAIYFYSCSDDIVNNNSTSYDTYVKVISAENGNLRFEMWSASGDTLMTGYNKIGFKVFENNQAKSSGYVKFFTKMYHTGGNDIHGTPVEPAYYYNSQMEMFTGYIIMLMPSDTTSSWYGFYNYNNQLYVDSVKYDVGWNRLAKFKIFVDLSTSLKYLITVLQPIVPVRNMNNFQCTLHESMDFIYFTQLNSAQMYIKPWLDSLEHASGNNVNPVHIGGGIYEGKVNFDYAGLWNVYDSVYYNNKWITPAGNPPSIVFIVP
ncbi:MAG TPA: hypothetical protein VJ455_01860 [Ignavibacteria bacterium]|nr:hypothetical protein [Ignavibacteria bacterium]